MYKRKQPTKYPDSEEHSYNYALFLLGIRMQTEGEMKFKMHNRGYTEATITSTLEKLKNNSLVNDLNFIETLVGNAKEYKDFGLFYLKKKLIEKRLSKELYEPYLAEHFLLADELVMAKRYIKKMRANLDAQDYVEKQKTFFKLSQRGFRREVIDALFSKENTGE